MKNVVGCLSFLFFTQVAFAAEPSFCNLKEFKKNEKPIEVRGLNRAHMYKIGQMTLVGMGVGNSSFSSVIELADQFGNYSPHEDNCTWYYNKGSDAAKDAFVYRYLPHPNSNLEEMADIYKQTLESSFNPTSPQNFISCIRNHQYLAMGCDGMRHRGPSAFAMFLAFTGCTPEHSVEIVNDIWGSNGVPTATRIEIAKRGSQLGDAQPNDRLFLQSMMAPPPAR